MFFVILAVKGLIVLYTISVRIMKLIIMRHGEAETFRVQDKIRSLTEHGEKQSLYAGKWMANYLGLEASIDIALVSSYERAQQTYQQLNSEVEVTSFLVCEDVIPEGDPKVAHDFIKALIEDIPMCNVILIVSHMPFVSYFLEEVHKDKQTMLFDTSSLVVVEYDVELAEGVIENIYHPE